MKQLYLLPLLAILALTGCKKDDDASRPGNLTIEKTEYTLDAAEERTATVAFTAVADWTLSVVYDDAESSADWLSVTPASGTAGEQTVELSATRNFRASARTAYADLSCGEQSVRLTVTQAASGDTNFTAQFDKAFAQELQKQDIIADAEHITPEDMEKIATITRLDVSGTYENRGTLTSLQGIEYFESLTYLNCDYNQLTELDVSRYTALTDLWCSYNQLTELDVSQNTALTDLGCSSNQLTALDVSRNTELRYFVCFNNQLTELDVSRNTELTILGCNTNQLAELDVSANTKLETLWCDYNQLTELDVSRNTELTYLDCEENPLTKLDVSANTKLETLSCAANSLTTLDVSRNTALTSFCCQNNQLTELDVSQNTALTRFWCFSNELTKLDVSQNTKLTDLTCFTNKLTELDLSRNTELTELRCEYNPGDGISNFPITAWFDNETVPAGLNVYSSNWWYDDKTITIDFRKAE